MAFKYNPTHFVRATYWYGRLQALLRFGHIRTNNKQLYVQPTAMKGDGLFTSVAHKKGSVIFVATGATHFWDPGADEVDVHQNWYAVDESVWIDLQAPYVKANHSNFPNMGISGARVFVALRDIAVGEELVFDYSITVYEPDWRMAYYENSDYIGEIGPIQTMSPERFALSYPYIPKHFIDLYQSAHGQQQLELC